MNREDWDKRIAAGRDRLEDENRREAEMINRMQNHCCLGLIALYTFGVFFAFLMSRVHEYPEVQATMIHLPVENQRADVDVEHLSGLLGAPGSATGSAGGTNRKRPRGESATEPTSKASSAPGPQVQPEPDNPGLALPPPIIDNGDQPVMDSKAEYAQTMNDLLETASSNLQNILAYGQEYIASPDVRKNKEWESEATNALLSLKSAAAQMNNMYRTPAAMRSVDIAAKRAAQHCMSIMNEYARAVAASSADAMKMALTHVPSVRTELSSVGTALDAAESRTSR